MVEADESTELVHLTRTAQHDHAAAPLRPPPPPPSLEDFAAVMSREVALARASDASQTAATASPTGTDGHTGTLRKEPARPPDDGAVFRQTRLAVTAGLVVLLLVVWIIQRRNGLGR